MTGRPQRNPFTAGTGREGMTFVASRCCQRVRAWQASRGYRLLNLQWLSSCIFVIENPLNGTWPTRSRPVPRHGFHPVHFLPEGAVQKGSASSLGPGTRPIAFLVDNFPTLLFITLSLLIPFCLPCVFFSSSGVTPNLVRLRLYRISLSALRATKEHLTRPGISLILLHCPLAFKPT